MTVSTKTNLNLLLLWLFFGGLSAHRFYVGKIGTALLQMFTFGGLGIWLLIDGILILSGNFRDKDGLKVKNWTAVY